MLSQSCRSNTHHPRSARRADHGEGWAPDGGRILGGVWEHEEPAPSGPGTPRAKAVLVLVVTAVMLVTLVLCCVAIGEAVPLIFLDPPRMF